MIKKKPRKLFFKNDFKKIIGKKTRFDNVDDIFAAAKQDDKRNKGINIDDVEHALSRKRMYEVSKHYAGNDRMHVSRAKAYKMHKIAYGKKSKRKDAEYLYQELKLTNKSTKAVVISNFLSSKSLETIYNIRLKKGRSYSLPPHVKTTMNLVVGEEKHKGIKLRLWNPLRKQRSTINASKLSTIPGTIADLKLNVGSKIAKKTKWKGSPITLIEEREIWKNAMNLINKKKIEKSSSLNWTAINDEITDHLTRCMIQKDTPLEQGIRARPGHGWKRVYVHQGGQQLHEDPPWYEVQKKYRKPEVLIMDVYKDQFGDDYGNSADFSKGGKKTKKYANKNDYHKQMYELYDNRIDSLVGNTFQEWINQLPTTRTKAAWRYYTEITGEIIAQERNIIKVTEEWHKQREEIKQREESLDWNPEKIPLWHANMKNRTLEEELFLTSRDYWKSPIVGRYEPSYRLAWAENELLSTFEGIWIERQKTPQQKLTKKQKRELFFANKKKYAKKK